MRAATHTPHLPYPIDSRKNIMQRNDARRTKRLTFIAVAVLSIAVAMLPIPGAFASTVVPMTVHTMADRAGQIVAGKIAAVRSYWAENPRRIETEVTLEQVTYLKGGQAEAPGVFTLVIPGGTVGETEMRICCAPVFRPGEKWVLFVPPSYKTFPVVGLFRGAFRVTPDPTGIERVYSSAAQPVLGMDPDGFVRMAGGNMDPHDRLIAAVNAEVRWRPSPLLNPPAISFEDFLALIQPILDTSRDHHLTEPAGRRVPVVYTPTTLARTDDQTVHRNTEPQSKRSDHAARSVRRVSPRGASSRRK